MTRVTDECGAPEYGWGATLHCPNPLTWPEQGEEGAALGHTKLLGFCSKYCLERGGTNEAF